MKKISKILVALVIIVMISFISYVGIFGLFFEGKESDFYVPTVTGDNISAYKNSCNELNLSQVSEDPIFLIGKKVKVTGQLYYKEENIDFYKKRTDIVLKVQGLSPDPYIIASYTGTLPFQKGDNITVFGDYFYPVQFTILPETADKALPSIKAGYIEKP